MATRSTIAMEFTDGTVKQVYCHWDGYLEGVGKTLVEHYTSLEKVESLLNEGSISILGKDIGEKHSFDDHLDGEFCTFYTRDRGDSHHVSSFGSIDDYERHRQYEEFDYLLTQDGVWNVFHDDDWNDLEFVLKEQNII